MTFREDVTMRFLIKLALLALAATLLIGGPTLAEDKVRIRGGGWGHGIGMSQYGALGRARAGDRPTKIVEHYYSRSQVRRRKTGRIRVGLLQYQGSIAVSSEAFTSGGGKIDFKVEGSPGKLATGGPDATFRVEASGTGGMRLYKNGDQVQNNGVGVFGSPAQPLVAIYERHDSMVRVPEKGHAYAYGRLEFGTYPSDRCGNFCLRLVVVQSMQKYLYGLGEVPASWPQSALKAQVIAARSYALDKVKRLGQHREPCDCAVFDSTFDQAYIGDSKRTGSGQYWDDWKRAVDTTDRKVAVFDGSAIQALYSSSSGGHTEHNENVWGGSALPYLRGVPDGPDAVGDNPNHKWRVVMGFNQFQSKLNAAFGIGNLKKFKVLKPRGVSGRVTVVKASDRGGVRIVGSRQTVRKSGWDVRNALGLRDTLFRVRIVHSVGQQFVTKYRRLDGATGRSTSRTYPVPRGGKRVLGRAQNFKHGRLTSRKGVAEVTWQFGHVLRKYNRIGRERSRLGMPTSDVWGPGRFRAATYTKGMITWSKKTGAHTIRARFKDLYQRLGGPRGRLGVAKTDRQEPRSLPKGGIRQRFRHGTLYLNPRNNRVVALWGPIARRYIRLGEARSRCGYPTGGISIKGPRKKAEFQRGKITARSGHLDVDCRR